MERFDVKRGLVKKVSKDGGLAALAGRYFEKVQSDGEQSFSASHGIMTSIEGRYNESGALIVDVTNIPPNFDDPDAVKAAMDARKRWTQFLDEATGYNSKQRGDKAKEWAKKASKAKSGISSAKHFMGMATQQIFQLHKQGLQTCFSGDSFMGKNRDAMQQHTVTVFR